MSDIIKLPLENVGSHLPKTKFGFVCNSSFEPRCLCIAQSIATLEHVLPLAFGLHDDSLVATNTQILIDSYVKNDLKVIPVKSRLPFDWSEAISFALNYFIKLDIKHIAVDVTTFTHESLLILIKHLYTRRQHYENIEFLYLGARDYSASEPKPENKWLTKGCRDIRTVLGYPGWMKPGFRTCLTVLVGYEHERATRMISEMEPDLLYLGSGISTDVTHENHKGPMMHFNNLVNDMVATRYNVKKFEFSCSKLSDTVSKIKSIINDNKDCNHIIVPLNTKISTVAVATFALENRDIQLCYAEPETYNKTDYAVPGDEVSVWEFTF